MRIYKLWFFYMLNFCFDFHNFRFHVANIAGEGVEYWRRPGRVQEDGGEGDGPVLSP